MAGLIHERTIRFESQGDIAVSEKDMQSLNPNPRLGRRLTHPIEQTEELT
jgi:hypothetical protein